MRKKAVYGLIVLGSSVLFLFGADNAFVGTWKLNVAKSSHMLFYNGKMINRNQVKDSMTTVMVDSDTTTVRMHDTISGKSESSEFTVPNAGGPLNYTEGPPPAGIEDTLKVINDRTDVFTSVQNGKTVLTTRCVVSADHKTLTITQTGADEKGKPFKSVEVYDRQSK